MSSTPTILVADDEPEIREMLREYLSSNGFQVTAVEDGAAVRAHLEETPCDLVLLDIAMPGEDGISLARYVRETYSCGIIMVTASDTVVDRIVGLEVGADDYVSKPFDLRELLARAKSVLRRAQQETDSGTRPTSAPASGNQVRFGRCLLDLETRKLTADDGEDVPITQMEFDLLQTFATHPNRVLNRDQLLEMSHNRSWEPFDRSIDIRIARLRRKIEPDPSKPQTIKTVRGAGYIYVTDSGQ
ncbi:MAG: response regulator [Pseudomonadota bacterium]